MPVIRYAATSVLCVVCLFVPGNAAFAQNAALRSLSFDQDWRFLRSDAPGAEDPKFDDLKWRILDVPHDWSIEDLPPQEDSPAGPEAAALSVVAGQWHFHKGDDLAWKTDSLDDRPWESVKLPDTWEHHSNYKDDKVYGWYRRRIKIPAENKGKDLDLLLGCIDDADETFFNGQRIGGTGSFPPEYHSAWDAQRRYRVPAALVHGDGTDLIAVRVYDENGNGGMYKAWEKPFRVGPFDSSLSSGGTSTGYFVGGVGWYRKHFTLTPAQVGKRVTVCFDGVYMNSDVWLNGRHLGNHPYGYTPFVFDLTDFLKSAGQENVLAIRVKNTGKNSRWYSGSGIYRHVQLTITDSVRIPEWGMHVVAENPTQSTAAVKVITMIENLRSADAAFRLRGRLISPNGDFTAWQEKDVRLSAGRQRELTLVFTVARPVLWSLENPALYRAEVELVGNQGRLDSYADSFGIRTLRFSADRGFELNGKTIKLKGGCMHHDNGPLGSAAIDRAEERRVQLMKEYGYNAIRCSHNPPSPAFLDACDRYGILVMDEAFDCWEWGKNPDDYGTFFDEWWRRDLDSMIFRDRNHPSVIMWSIGNEIPQRGDKRGFEIAKQLSDEVHRLDLTRPVTEAICRFFEDGRPWSAAEPMFDFLDVGGYNYLVGQYVPDHQKFPERVMVGTESFPMPAFEYWKGVLDHSFVIGDFVWTSWDYLGETGLGPSNGPTETVANPTRSFSAYCGDIDICGFKKPQAYYREVVWGGAQVNLAVSAPKPAWSKESLTDWGWIDERQSWTWPGFEGKQLDVTVYSSCKAVRLELNGKEIGTQTPDKMIAHFKVPYSPGELRASGLSGSQSVASASLRTAGRPRKILLSADRSTIRASRNDLSYIKVEIVDQLGEVVPNEELTVRFTVTGAGELAATGSGASGDFSSFQKPLRKTWQGRCLAILRPGNSAGTITLQAEADGLEAASISVTTR